MAHSHQEEIAKLEALFAEHPEGRVFTHLAEAYRKAGELEQAREILSHGLQRHPDYSSAHVVLGRVLLDLGQADAAREAFARVLQLDPHNLVALRNLGDIHRGRGERAEAIRYYRDVLALDPGNRVVEETVAELEGEGPAGAVAEERPATSRGEEPPGSAAAEVTADEGEDAGGMDFGMVALDGTEAGPARDEAEAAEEPAGVESVELAGAVDLGSMEVAEEPPTAGAALDVEVVLEEDAADTADADVGLEDAAAAAGIEGDGGRVEPTPTPEPEADEVPAEDPGPWGGAVAEEGAEPTGLDDEVPAEIGDFDEAPAGETGEEWSAGLESDALLDEGPLRDDGDLLPDAAAEHGPPTPWREAGAEGEEEEPAEAAEPPEPAEPVEAEASPAEPWTEPAEAEAGGVESQGAEPWTDGAEPAEAEAEPAEPWTAETEPAEADAEPAEPWTAETEPAEAEAEPAEPWTAGAEPAEPAEAEAEPAEPWTAETEPAEAEAEAAQPWIAETEPEPTTPWTPQAAEGAEGQPAEPTGELEAAAPPPEPDARAPWEPAPAWDEEEPAAAGEVSTETIGDLYFRQGLYDHAADVYRRLLERQPDEERLRVKLADAQAKLERPPDAEPAAGPEWGDLAGARARADEPPTVAEATAADEPPAGAGAEHTAAEADAEPDVVFWGAEAEDVEAATAGAPDLPDELEPGEAPRGRASGGAVTAEPWARAAETPAQGGGRKTRAFPEGAPAASSGEAPGAGDAPGGPSTAEFLRDILAWRPAAPVAPAVARPGPETPAPAEAEPAGPEADAPEPPGAPDHAGAGGADAASAPSAPAEPEPWADASTAEPEAWADASTAEPEPWAEASTDPTPPTPAAPAPSAGGGDFPWEAGDAALEGGEAAPADEEPDAFLELGEAELVEPPDASPPEAPEAPGAASDDEDLEMFRSWLQSLKR